MRSEERAPYRSLMYSVAASLLALGIANLYFPSVVRMAATALIALSLSNQLRGFLEQNRREIWDLKTDPVAANAALATALATLFLGIFFAGLVYEMALGSATLTSFQVKGAFQSSYANLLEHNAVVFLAGSLLALLYGAGGLMLVLAWNGLHWAEALVSIGNMGGSGTLAAGLAVMAALPHLIAELLAYVISGMGGIFFGKAILKYHPLSDEFFRVSRACVVLILAAAFSLCIACVLEVYFAQPLIAKLRS